MLVVFFARVNREQSGVFGVVFVESPPVVVEVVLSPDVEVSVAPASVVPPSDPVVVLPLVPSVVVPLSALVVVVFASVVPPDPPSLVVPPDPESVVVVALSPLSAPELVAAVVVAASSKNRTLSPALTSPFESISYAPIRAAPVIS